MAFTALQRTNKSSSQFEKIGNSNFERQILITKIIELHENKVDTSKSKYLLKNNNICNCTRSKLNLINYCFKNFKINIAKVIKRDIASKCNSGFFLWDIPSINIVIALTFYIPIANTSCIFYNFIAHIFVN